MNEKATTEIEIEVSKGRITEAYVMPDGKCKLVIEVTAPKCASTVVAHPLGDTFVKVEASKLSLDDKFMEYVPQTKEEKKFKELIEVVIEKGIKDFYRPKYDPSFNKEWTGICYKAGLMPAMGKSYNWWVEAAKEFKPARRSRLGTQYEYIAFLAVLIKKMVESGWPAEKAWHAVCNDSKILGHYWNSEDAKHNPERTGCREILGFCDLANTYKILAESEDGRDYFYWIACGTYKSDSTLGPIAAHKHKMGIDDPCIDGTGWLVLEI